MVTEKVPNAMDEMTQKIIDQVEYYFGDINIKHDKFMKSQLEQNEGWFLLEKLMTFNRLKSLTTDNEVVVNALKKSTSGLIEVSECGTKLRRLKPVPEESEEYVKALNSRTIHLKGFPKDSVLDDLKKFCSQYGKVESLEMRRKQGVFKGCIFVVFENVDDANKVLESSDVKYNEIELLKENKEKYYERKKAFYDSLKKKKLQKAQDGVGLILTEGAILKITDLAPNTKFMDIKEELSKLTKVAFVSTITENGECSVRFAEKDGAKTALASLQENKLEGSDDEKLKVELIGQQVHVSLVTGDEEKRFWAEFKTKQSMSNNKNKWQRGKKRRFDGDSREESANKVAKDESA